MQYITKSHQLYISSTAKTGSTMMIAEVNTWVETNNWQCQ